MFLNTPFNTFPHFFQECLGNFSQVGFIFSLEFFNLKHLVIVKKKIG